MSDESRERLGASLWALVLARDAPLVRVEEFAAAWAGGTRRTYRLSFEDGSVLKGRRFASATRANVVWRILVTAAAPFLGRAIAHEGDAILEEWIDGEPLVQGHVDDGALGSAGRLLGTLHTSPPPSTDDLDFQPLDGFGWVQKTAANLRALREQGLITASHADHLHVLVTSRVPTTVPLGVVHRDLCPENLITGASGQLISVDNGSVTIGAIDYDLARVWYRWPMTADERAAFVAGYREHRDIQDFGQPSPFWVIAVVANSARGRLGRSTAAAAAALDWPDPYVSVGVDFIS